MPNPSTQSSGLDRLLQGTIAAVRDGGELLRQEFQRPEGPRGSGSKADVDEEIEWLLRTRLLALLPAFYRGEETGTCAAGLGSEDWCWLVDPHDGTSAFLKGHRGSAVSVALLWQGAPLLGVVYAPLSPDRGDDLIAWAEGCGPVTRNGAASTVDLSGRRLEYGEIVFVSQDAPRKPVTNTTLCMPARFVALPSIAYRLARVAVGDGVAGVSLSAPVGWDYAAGHALLRGAGGVLLDEKGKEVVYRPDGRSQCGDRCFGGARAAATALSIRPWDAIFSGREDKAGLRVSLAGPRAEDNARLERAIGVMLGQCIGDSLGSLVEFLSPADIAHRYPEGVRNLADGGTWNTIAGQPTDDSELAITLARAIVDRDGYDEEHVARSYAMWLDSDPFDAGETTTRALVAALTAIADKRPVADAARNAASRSVPANGSLMRVSPIGIWCAGRPEEAARVARCDSSLTHGNPVCVEACAAYVAAIAVGVAGGGCDTMFDAAHAVLTNTLAGTQVGDVLLKARDGVVPDAYTRHQGWVLMALQIAFRQLLLAGSFEEGLVETVGLGGDTDTNAAITGALLGSFHGRGAIPARWVLPVLACRPIHTRATHPRPMRYWPDDVVELAEALLAGSGKQRS